MDCPLFLLFPVAEAANVSAITVNTTALTVVEHGVTGLPERQGHTGGESRPQQQQPTGPACELGNGTALVRLPSVAEGQPDGDEPDQKVQHAADGKTCLAAITSALEFAASFSSFLMSGP